MKNRLITTLMGLSGLGLIALVLTLAACPVQAQAAEPPITLTIDASPAVIQAGEQVQFKATLENTNNDNLQNLLLTLTLTGPVDRMQPAIIQAESNGMRTDRMRREGNVIQWKGDLQAGGQVTLGLRADTSPIAPDGQEAELKLEGEAGPAGGDPVTNASKTAAVTFPGPVDPAQIDLEKRFLDQEGNPLMGMLEGGKIVALPGQQVIVELRLTNNSDQTLYSLLVDSMAPSEASAAAAGQVGDACRLQVIKAGVTQRAGFKVPLDALGNPLPDGLMADAITGVFMIKTGPDQTSVARVRARVVGAPDCELEGQLRAYSTAVAPGNGELENADADTMEIDPTRLAFIQGLLQEQPKLGALIVLIILLNDYGDAPDSSNHFGVNMTAYAPNVTANFPTVFDPATGAPPGPKHKNGLPLHLGPLVSGEWNADRFLRRNLDPSADLADLDLRDDGVDPLTLNFQHCVPTTIPFQVTVNQTAVDYFASSGETAYLNIWLDGNHDGDWEDVLDCDGIQAVEHIVIDQPVAPATAGLFNLVAPTGNIPAPLGGESESMWLRVTISDEPAEKPFQVISLGQVIDYGDGRGPANGFRWGETEDYLYVPAAAAQGAGGFGPNLRLNGEAIVQTGLEDGSLQAAGAEVLSRDQIALKARIRNRGDRTAHGSRLIVELDPYGGIPTIQGNGWTGCLTCTVASRVAPLSDSNNVIAEEWPPVQEICQGEECHLEVLLGDLPPGAGGELLMIWQAPVGQEFNFDLRMESSNGGGSSFQTRATRLRRPPIITSPRSGVLGWTGCLTCTVAFKGFADPGVEVGIFSEGFETGNLSALADDKGFWQIDARLPDGTHEVLAWTGCLTCTVQAQGVNDIPQGSITSEPLVLAVDSSLKWNPVSFGFSYTDENVQAAATLEGNDSCGPWSVVDDAGRMDLDGWKMPVWAGKAIEVGLNGWCEGVAAATLQVEGLDEYILTDEDGDGRFITIFTLNGWEEGVAALKADLILSCDEETVVYTGEMTRIEPATVVDASSGQAVDGADFLIWQQNVAAAGPQASPWEAHAFGQSNPQTTDENGQFSFIAPAGVYGLTAQIDGFQPFRAGPFRLQGAFPARTIVLTPVQTGTRTVRVRITEDGFDPPVLRVEPGTVIEWVNVDLGVATTASGTPDGVTASADGGMNWDSGLLSAGERYRMTFTKEGEYTYVDSENPASQATIRVLPPAPETDASIFLPIVTR